MLKRLSNQAKPRETTKMDKLRAHFLEGKKLGPVLEKTLHHLNRANALMCEGYSREQTVSFLMTELELGRSSAYLIINEALELFGDVTKSSKDGMRHVSTENLMRIQRTAEEKGLLDIAKDCWKEINKINKLHIDGEEGEGTQLAMNFQFNFTTDPKVLQVEQQLQLPL